MLFRSKQAILCKAGELNRNPSGHLAIAQEIVGELRAHIDGIGKIEEAGIESRISKLTACTLGIPVSIPLSSSTLFARGVKYLENDGDAFYKKTSRLSYIPSEDAHKVRQGRLNKAGEPIFYACLEARNDSVATVLAEIDANKGDIVNLLYSVTQDNQPGALHIMPVGIMDYFRRGIPLPFNLHPVFKEIYELFRELSHPTAMEAIHLCDEFMNSILTAKANEESCLYDLTSVLAKDFLAASQLDGILYQSTKSAKFPNVALRPSAVDKKLRYAGASAYRIIDRLEEAQFTLQCLGNGIIEGDRIVWLTANNT